MSISTLLVAAQRLERIDAAERAIKSAIAYSSDAGLSTETLVNALDRLASDRDHARDTFDRMRAGFEATGTPHMYHRFTYHGQDADIPDEFRVNVQHFNFELWFTFCDSATGETVARVEFKRGGAFASGWYVFKDGEKLNIQPFRHPINAIRFAAKELI